MVKNTKFHLDASNITYSEMNDKMKKIFFILNKLVNTNSCFSSKRMFSNNNISYKIEKNHGDMIIYFVREVIEKKNCREL